MWLASMGLPVTFQNIKDCEFQYIAYKVSIYACVTCDQRRPADGLMYQDMLEEKLRLGGDGRCNKTMTLNIA